MDELRRLAHFDQSRRAQFLEMMRERGGRNWQIAAQVHAGKLVLSGNAGEYLVTHWIGHNSGYAMELRFSHMGDCKPSTLPALAAVSEGSSDPRHNDRCEQSDWHHDYSRFEKLPGAHVDAFFP